MIIFTSIVLGLATAMCVLFASNDESEYANEFISENA